MDSSSLLLLVQFYRICEQNEHKEMKIKEIIKKKLVLQRKFLSDDVLNLHKMFVKHKNMSESTVSIMIKRNDSM